MLKLYTAPKLIDFLQVCRNIPADEREQYEAFIGRKYDFEEVAAAFSLQPGPSFMLCVDETPIVVAGFQMIRPGVYQDWMFSTPIAWTQYWKGVTQYSRRVMNMMLKGDAHRLQCVSLSSRIRAHRWYKSLGLEQEGGVLRQYGVDGQDALMFSRLRA